MRWPIGDNQSVRNYTNARASTMPRFRFRIATILFVVAILALLLVVSIQQVRIAQMMQEKSRREKALAAELRATLTNAQREVISARHALEADLARAESDKKTDP
jgi:hypothetical protein